MKKVFLSLCALMVTVAFSQKKFAIEVKAGANLVSGTSLNDFVVTFSSKSGLIAGVLGTYFLSDRVGVKSGVIYDQRGFEGDLDFKILNIIPVNANATIEVNTLTIPFYLQYETAGKKLKGFFYAGPYASIPLNTKISTFIANLNLSNPNTEFGLGAGAGLILPVSRSLDFMADASFKSGINKTIFGRGRLHDFAVMGGIRKRF